MPKIKCSQILNTPFSELLDKNSGTLATPQKAMQPSGSLSCCGQQKREQMAGKCKFNEKDQMLDNFRVPLNTLQQQFRGHGSGYMGLGAATWVLMVPVL